MLYSVVMVSAIHHCESALSIHMSPPSRASLPPLHPGPLGHQQSSLAPHSFDFSSPSVVPFSGHYESPQLLNVGIAPACSL